MLSKQLSAYGGEFLDGAREAAFQAERLPETLRHARLLFVFSVVLNSLFLISDWRFYGDPHFFYAVPARLIVVLMSVLCLAAIRKARTFPQAERVMVAWEVVAALAISVLVSSRSEIALFVVIMLPSIFYLVVPTSFRWTLIGGIGCSLAMLAGYMHRGQDPSTATGLVLAMLILNCALILVVLRSNRLRRLEWAATQAERSAKEDLAESRAMLENVFMAVPIPLVVTRKAGGEILKANAAAREFFGAHPLAAPPRTEELYVDPGARAGFLAALEADGRVSGYETAIRLADGSVRNMLFSATLSEVGGEASIIIGAVDITSRAAHQLHLEQLANTDFLTGLINRSRFFDIGAKAVVRAEETGRGLSVLMIDIDDFKRINDTYGHQMGDAVLQAFAVCCQGILRERDIVARFGGEEFAALLPGTDEAAATAIAERLRSAVEKLRPIPGTEATLTVSIGVAERVADEHTLDPALSRADRALYAAKFGGRNRVVSFSSICSPQSKLRSAR